MNNIFITYFKTPYGELIIGSYDNQLVLCDWRYRKLRGSIDKRIQGELTTQYEEKQSDISEQTKQQLTEYFNHERDAFNIPILFVGTEFQKGVWNELLKIPFGKTETYLGLSKKLGDEKAIRAVASANGANAISIMVPCHRVIGSNQELIGYAGGLDTKKKLLELEGILKPETQLNLFS